MTMTIQPSEVHLLKNLMTTQSINGYRGGNLFIGIHLGKQCNTNHESQGLKLIKTQDFFSTITEIQICYIMKPCVPTMECHRLKNKKG